jgi:glycosyltransferase involved in cell wall biosynthesis
MKNKVSLIIAVYKRVDFLELIFKSIEKQTFRNFQVIIAEDDCSPNIKNFLD